MKKRLCAVMAALVLCGSSVLSSPAALPVKAASLPVALADEGTMLLLDIFMQCLVAAGVTEALDYNDEVVLFTAFMDDVALPENAYLDGIKVRLADGSTMSMSEALANGYTDGTGALQIPDEETWAKFRVIDGGSSGDSGDNQEPEGPYEEISDFTVNGAFFSYVADWIVSLWNGEVEGINPDDYYVREDDGLPLNYFDGAYSADNSSFWIHYINNNTNSGLMQICNFEGDDYYYGLIYRGVDSGRNTNIYDFACYSPATGSVISGVNLTGTAICGGETSVANATKIFCGGLYSVTTNLPVFETADDMIAFYTDASVAPANGLAYDYAALAEALPAVLFPLTDVALSPNALPAVSAAICAAAQALPEPEPAIDPAENTETYVQAVTDAVVAVAPDVAPDAAPETDPALDPTDIEIVNNYKFDLTQVFPFCLPFDLIRFLEALAAEPEAPRFEIPFVVPALGIDLTYVIDLSFMDEVMEIVRFCELVGFCFALVMLTPKMIKW